VNALWVFLGGGCGSVLRFALSAALPAGGFPWATLAANWLGSFAIGLFSGWSAHFGWSDGVRLALTTGLCGGFTTFSTFSKESLAFAQTGRWAAFALYAAGSVACALAAVALGHFLARS